MARELFISELHDSAHNGFYKGNNRKLTKGRKAVAYKVQSIPVSGTVNIDGSINVNKKGGSLLGFKYIYHQ